MSPSLSVSRQVERRSLGAPPSACICAPTSSPLSSRAEQPEGWAPPSAPRSPAAGPGSWVLPSH